MKTLEVGQWSDWFPLKMRGLPARQGRMRVFRFEADRYYLTPIYRVDDGLVLSHPKELRRELDEQLGEPYIPEGPGWSRHAEEDTPKYLYDHLLQVAEIQSRAAAYLARQPWAVFIYVNTFVDRVSHPYWAYSRPQDYDGLDRAKAARYADRVRRSYIETDKQLANVLAAAKGEFYVVIVSDHGFHSNRDKKKYIGTHDFDGVYLVSGAALDQVDGGRMFIEDVTPTVLYLLDKPVGEDMKGKVIPAVAAAVGRPVETVPSYEQGGKVGSDMPVDGKTWEQLRALGYVDGAPPRKQKPSNR